MLAVEPQRERIDLVEAELTGAPGGCTQLRARCRAGCSWARLASLPDAYLLRWHYLKKECMYVHQLGGSGREKATKRERQQQQLCLAVGATKAEADEAAKLRRRCARANKPNAKIYLSQKKEDSIVSARWSYLLVKRHTWIRCVLKGGQGFRRRTTSWYIL